MNEPVNERNQAIHWEDHHIAAEAGILPEKLREPYVWLKTFLRDKCNRDLDVLTQKFRDRGVTVDKTNWTRICKGRWRIDTRGEECTPCISQENFINSIIALREHIRVEVLEGTVPFVETSIWTVIKNFVDKKMRRERVNRFGMIVGPTGTQKTACYKELARRNRLVKWMEAPENGSIKEFTCRLAHKFGGGSSISYFSARNKLFANATPEHCIIVDNTQALVRDPKQLERMGKVIYSQPAYEFMRAFQDETGCAIIWSITPENEEQMFSARDESHIIYNEQFEGRCGGVDGFLRLPNFSPKRDILLITEELGFTFDEARHGDRLLEISKERGRIRRYFEILQEAKDLADLEKVRPGMKHIESVMTRIAEDAARRITKKGGRP